MHAQVFRVVYGTNDIVFSQEARGWVGRPMPQFLN
jgi:hypothetical protein